MIFSSEAAVFCYRRCKRPPSESVVAMPVSVGHRQPAFTAVVGGATRREQILTDEDEIAGRDHRDPTELMIHHFGGSGASMGPKVMRIR